MALAGTATLSAERGPTDQPRRGLVIGYGSPIRGDDAIGPLVADRLQREGVPDGVEVIARHILTADLVPDIALADVVVFVDASVEGAPGEIDCRPIAPDASQVSAMAHFLGPGELLAWAATLYDSHPDAWLVTTCGLSFDYASYELSPALSEVLDNVKAKVLALVLPDSVTGG